MKKNISRYALLVATLLIPYVSFAAQAFGGLKDYLVAFGGILKLVIPVLFGLAFIFFFWGVGQFILNDAGNDKTRDEGKMKMIWGVIALFVMVAIYGILSTISGLTGIPIQSSIMGN